MLQAICVFGRRNQHLGRRIQPAADDLAHPVTQHALGLEPQFQGLPGALRPKQNHLKPRIAIVLVSHIEHFIILKKRIAAHPLNKQSKSRRLLFRSKTNRDFRHIFIADNSRNSINRIALDGWQHTAIGNNHCFGIDKEAAA